MESLSLGEKIRRIFVTTALAMLPFVPSAVVLYNDYRSSPKVDIDGDGKTELMCERSIVERALGKGRYFVPTSSYFSCIFEPDDIDPISRLTEDGQFVSTGFRLKMDRARNALVIVDEDGNSVYELIRPVYWGTRPWG